MIRSTTKSAQLCSSVTQSKESARPHLKKLYMRGCKVIYRGKSTWWLFELAVMIFAYTFWVREQKPLLNPINLTYGGLVSYCALIRYCAAYSQWKLLIQRIEKIPLWCEAGSGGVLTSEYMHLSSAKVKIELDFKFVVDPLIIKLSSAGAVSCSEWVVYCSFEGFTMMSALLAHLLTWAWEVEATLADPHLIIKR